VIPRGSNVHSSHRIQREVGGFFERSTRRKQEGGIQGDYSLVIEPFGDQQGGDLKPQCFVIRNQGHYATLL